MPLIFGIGRAWECSYFLCFSFAFFLRLRKRNAAHPSTTLVSPSFLFVLSIVWNPFQFLS